MVINILINMVININLVGGFNPFEKYEFVSWDDDIPNIYIYMET